MRKNNINSDINIVGSIPDYNLIDRFFELLSTEKDAVKVSGLLMLDNDFNFRTEKSKSRFVEVLKSTFGNFNNPNHQDFIYSFYSFKHSRSLKNYMIFIQFANSNKLFYKLNESVFFASLYQGKLYLDKELALSFMLDLSDNYPVLKSWSNNTRETVASKYLTILKKLNFVEGKVKKEFRYSQPDFVTFVVLLYAVIAISGQNKDIINNPFVDYLFLDKETIFTYLKKVQSKEFFDIEYIGEKINVTTKLNYNDLFKKIYAKD